MSVTPLLCAENLQVEVMHKTLLDDINLQLEPGELLGLIGPNGAGKSTLLQALVQLLPYQGDVQFAGRSLRKMSAIDRARQLAFLQQSAHVSWPISVYDFVAIGRQPHRKRWSRYDHQRDQEVVEAAMLQTGILSFQNKPLNQLSGGEFARARLARVLAVEAPLLLADEPVAALDPFHQLSVMELLNKQCKAGKAMIVVLHDLTLASRFCDRLLLLDKGKLVAAGKPKNILTPANLQKVYKVNAMVGEHQQQSYVLPWGCHTTDSSYAEMSKGVN